MLCFADLKHTLNVQSLRESVSIKSNSPIPRREILGKHCSAKCLQYGHGDACWMPLIGL